MATIILKRRNFEMPQKCCVCGSDTPHVISDRQEGLPSVLPTLIPTVYKIRVESWEISAPYCEQHGKAYIRRQRNYYFLQTALVLGGVVLMVVFDQPKVAANPLQYVASSLILIAVSLFLFKRVILYDLRIKATSEGLRMSAPSSVFLAAVEDAASRPVEKKPAGTPEEIGDRLKQRIRVNKARKRIYGDRESG